MREINLARLEGAVSESYGVAWRGDSLVSAGRYAMVIVGLPSDHCPVPHRVYRGLPPVAAHLQLLLDIRGYTEEFPDFSPVLEVASSLNVQAIVSPHQMRSICADYENMTDGSRETRLLPLLDWSEPVTGAIALDVDILRPLLALTDPDQDVVVKAMARKGKLCSMTIVEITQGQYRLYIMPRRIW